MIAFQKLRNSFYNEFLSLLLTYYIIIIKMKYIRLKLIALS